MSIERDALIGRSTHAFFRAYSVVKCPNKGGRETTKGDAAYCLILIQIKSKLDAILQFISGRL